MRHFKPALTTVLAVSMVFTAVLYTSCYKEHKEIIIANFDRDCQSVVCYNGGTCAGGVCTCPTGYEGANCQREWSLKFAGTWEAVITKTYTSDPYDFRSDYRQYFILKPSVSDPQIIVLNMEPGLLGPTLLHEKNIVLNLTSPRIFTLPAPLSYGEATVTWIKELEGTISETEVSITGHLTLTITRYGETHTYAYDFILSPL